MKKLLSFLLPALLLAGCSKNISRLLVDPKNPAAVPPGALFTYGQFELANYATTPDVNTNIFELIDQYWDETTYTDESNYDLGTRLIPDGWWDAWYGSTLINFEKAKQFAPTYITDPGELKNDLAIINIHEVYGFYNLVLTFGNIPYSQAFNSSNNTPAYDDAKTVFLDLAKRLDSAITDLDESQNSWGSADFVYGGDPDKWKAFASSLKLKMGIVLADSDPATAKTLVESAAPGVFKSNADNALYTFQSAPPYANPIWVNLVQSGRHDYVADQTILNTMKTRNDPRIPAFFNEDADGNYSGGVAGKGNSYSTLSSPADGIQDPTYPGDLLDFAEVQFNLAEAAARGFSVGGTAAGHYDSAVTASIEFWGGSAADAATYLAQPSVAYATAAGDYKEKIATQEYIALYTRGFDAWVLIRRLGFPKLPAPVNAKSAFPLRFIYPVKESNVNEGSRSAAAAAIGGDNVTTKLFFDVN